MLAAVLAGCGLGPGGDSKGTATLTVTRDYGSVPMVTAEVRDPADTDTVMRVLDREAEIETRYGGGFVQSIDGVAGHTRGERRYDWFYYVNGVEAPVGAAERRVLGGDRIWWDHRDWTEAMRVPAVVGSWPEPFLQASAGADRLPVRVECAGTRPPCEVAIDALDDAGVSGSIVDFGAARPGEALRIVVGPWRAIRSDPAARQVADGPAASGVFAREYEGALTPLDWSAAPVPMPADGFVAATRVGEDPPTWLVTGNGRAGVGAAARALADEALRDRYAVVTVGGEATPLPAAPGEAAP